MITWSRTNRNSAPPKTSTSRATTHRRRFHQGRLVSSMVTSVDPFVLPGRSVLTVFLSSISAIKLSYTLQTTYFQTNILPNTFPCRGMSSVPVRRSRYQSLVNSTSPELPLLQSWLCRVTNPNALSRRTSHRVPHDRLDLGQRAY